MDIKVVYFLAWRIWFCLLTKSSRVHFNNMINPLKYSQQWERHCRFVQLCYEWKSRREKKIKNAELQMVNNMVCLSCRRSSVLFPSHPSLSQDCSITCSSNSFENKLAIVYKWFFDTSHVGGKKRTAQSARRWLRLNIKWPGRNSALFLRVVSQLKSGLVSLEMKLL